MQHPTSVAARSGVEIGSLWIDPAHPHRLVEVIQPLDPDHVRLRPVREHAQQPSSYLETAAETRRPLPPVRP
jgi:hypothetical protein